MLYFAYGSNLSHEQMQKRCKDSKYIKNFFLEGYNLIFCSYNRRYGVANLAKKSDSKVPGGIWKISTSDEKQLDNYEGFPFNYTKDFFKLNGEKVMFYIMKKKHSFKSPLKQYVDVIYQGYKDCDLDRGYLIKSLRYFNIELH